MTLRCLFHLHTRHSFDSMMRPARIVEMARSMSVDVLIVTDHDTVRGSEEAALLASGNPRFVIRAAEYKTEIGDVIGLFLKKEVRSRKSMEVVQEIHEQGGLAALPHPYKGHRLSDQLVREVDLIESYNGRCSPVQNRSAAELARNLNKPDIAGCDAHCYGELKAAINEFETGQVASEADVATALLSAPRIAITAPVSRAYEPCSQMIKAFKTRNPWLFAYQAKRLLVLLRESI